MKMTDEEVIAVAKQHGMDNGPIVNVLCDVAAGEVAMVDLRCDPPKVERKVTQTPSTE